MEGEWEERQVCLWSEMVSVCVCVVVITGTISLHVYLPFSLYLKRKFSVINTVISLLFFSFRAVHCILLHDSYRVKKIECRGKITEFKESTVFFRYIKGFVNSLRTTLTSHVNEMSVCCVEPERLSERKKT